MITLDHVKQALTLPDFDGFSGQMGMSPQGRERMRPDPQKPPRQSAVLVLLYPRQQDDLHVLLTRRTDHLRGHSGQVSFPGGRIDDEDADHRAAALREACEECGICRPDALRLLGELTTMWIPPSNFEVHPVVAALPQQPVITPNPAEVASILHLSLGTLLDDATKRTTTMNFRGQPMKVPYYDVEGHIVWGATAGMLSELEQRLRRVLSQSSG